jgi:hypothetical protein
MRNDRVIGLNRIAEFMVLPFLFPVELILESQGPEEAKNPAGEMSSA